MAGLVDPLRPEPIETLPGGLEHGLAEIVAGRGAKGMAGEVAVDRRPEALGPQVPLQHFQHQRALGIDDVGVVGRKGSPSARVPGEVLPVLLEVEVLLGVTALFHAPVLPGHELRHALVKPVVGPVLRRHQVAEPLVRQLVGDERVEVPGAVAVGTGVGQPVHQRRRPDVFHPADEVGRGHLRVLVPGIPDAGEPDERLHHIGSNPEQRAGACAVLGVDVVVEGHSTPPVPQPHQGSRDQRDQVGGGGLLLRPVRGAEPARHPAIAHQAAVGDHREARGHGGDHLPGRLVVGSAVGRDPARVSVGAPAAVDLLGTVGAARLLLEEVEAAALHDAAVIVDGESQRVAEGRGAREANDQRIARALVAQRPAPRRHRADLEPPLHVQHHRIERRPPRHDRRGHPAVERGRVPVEVLHLDALVDQVVVVRRREGAVYHPLEVGLGRGRRREQVGGGEQSRAESHVRSRGFR